MGAALAGCAVGPNYRTPHTALPASFIATTAAAEGAAPVAPAVDAAQWWHALNDPQLDALIERAIRANPDIEIALTRLQEARTAQAGLTSTLLPQAGAGAGAAHGSGSDLTRGRAPEALVAGDNGARGGPIQQVVGFDAGWEIDLFGKYRREIEEAKYNTRAAAWARNAVLIAVIADVARAYVDMRGLQMRLAVTRQDVATAEQFRDLVHARYDRGLTNELDVTLADRELATLQSEIAPFVSAINALQYAIAALLGDYPQALAAELAKPGLIPAIPAQVAAGSATRAPAAASRYSAGGAAACRGDRAHRGRHGGLVPAACDHRRRGRREFQARHRRHQQSHLVGRSVFVLAAA